LSDELSEFFLDCDLGGYNINRFDVPMLMQEFHRWKKYPIKVSEVKLVDSMSIFHKIKEEQLLYFFCTPP
jgi:DNA polymerase-3 subunit epsilon